VFARAEMSFRSGRLLLLLLLLLLLFPTSHPHREDATSSPPAATIAAAAPFAPRTAAPAVAGSGEQPARKCSR